MYILTIINIFCQNAMVHYSNTQKVGSSIPNAEKDERLPQAFFSSGGLELAIVKFGQAVILLWTSVLMRGRHRREKNRTRARRRREHFCRIELK